ncbi:bifunctional nicotinamidase/pyrazinamidase [Hymenobacter jeollabukensis]|uniref:Nicotinamidase n=1 Tax=Hymenobacter jeollabukensis TaxID=2025313 RepID=A0A5R8WWV5_9BACT|nr:bifunctional nicotinamidase/pyrazinamidase [Hymenobacter jeollabukensis]TLM97017.1 bifunctional nicotinamidase/pyrazinamidase [Hymenobacter jeollabukensis]
MKALLLIDIQNDFVPGGALAVPGGADIIPLVNRLQPQFDLVVATQDWHPAGHLSFASSHPGRQVFDRIELYGLAQVLWPDHCVQGTTGAELHPDLDQHRIEAIFRKGMAREIDSYSGFFDNGHRRSTGLAAYLRGREVTEVYLAGLAADYCVFYSAKDARGQGFDTFIIEDATRAISPEGFEQAKAELHQLGGHLVHSRELLG